MLIYWSVDLLNMAKMAGRSFIRCSIISWEDKPGVKLTIMPWTCPTCDRTFKNRNQSHSCLVIKTEDHFKDKPEQLVLLFDQLIEEVKKNGPVRIQAVKNAILVSANSTFLAVKPKKHWLDLEFILDHAVEGFPIFRTVRASRNRYAHFLKIESPDELNRQLIEWLKESYKTVNNA